MAYVELKLNEGPKFNTGDKVKVKCVISTKLPGIWILPGNSFEISKFMATSSGLYYILNIGNGLGIEVEERHLEKVEDDNA